MWVESKSLVSFSLHALVTWYPLSTSSFSLWLLTDAWNHLHGLLCLAQLQPRAICSFQLGMLLEGKDCQPQPYCPSPVPMTVQALSGKANGIIKYSKILQWGSGHERQHLLLNCAEKALASSESGWSEGRGGLSQRYPRLLWVCLCCVHPNLVPEHYGGKLSTDLPSLVTYHLVPVTCD